MKNIESKLRLASGIVLAIYLTQHLINHAFGIASFEAAEAFRTSVALVFQTPPGQVLLYGSFLFHTVIALRSIYLKSSFRMPFWQWAQLAMGLAILPLLAGHVIFTRGMDWVAGVDPLLTAVGDNINIAARLEAQTKTLGCDIVVSVETLAAEGIAYPIENVCDVTVRGRNEKVKVCKLSEAELFDLEIS